MSYKMSFKAETFTKPIMRDLERADKRLRAQAAAHVKSKIKAKIKNPSVSLPGSPPGMDTGNLVKGLRVSNRKTVSLVGFKAPAYHALLLEFGTKNMAPRPVLFPTFSEESPAVRRILSQEWL